MKFLVHVQKDMTFEVDTPSEDLAVAYALVSANGDVSKEITRCTRFVKKTCRLLYTEEVKETTT